MSDSDISDGDFDRFAAILVEWTALEGEEMEFEPESTHGGSRIGKKPNIDRNHLVAHEQLWKDYFSDNPTYTPQQFRRRYRMSKRLFYRIQETLRDHDVYFEQRRDATRRLGLSTLQKVSWDWSVP
jgi:hypothetical protein